MIVWNSSRINSMYTDCIVWAHSCYSWYFLILHAEVNQRKDKSWERLGSKSQVVRITHMWCPYDLNSLFLSSRPALIILNHESAGLQIACGKFLFAWLLCMPHPIQTFGDGRLYCMHNFYKEALTFPIPLSAVVPADAQNPPQCFRRGLASGSRIHTHTCMHTMPLLMFYH